MTDSDDLRARLIEGGLGRVAGELVDSVAECISIVTEQSSDDEIAVGASKFGGQPDLPADFQWPHWQGRPLSFLGQIDLSTLAKNPVAESLPSAGLLSFFYDPEQSTWGFDPKDRGSWSVQLFSEQGLQRFSLPEAIPEYACYSACKLEFVSALTLPGWESEVVQSLKLTDTEQDAFFELYDGFGDVGHHLIGYPQEIQNAMQLECQLVSNGIYCGGTEGYNDPRVSDLERGVGDWVLLLQIDSDDKPYWMWGDSGRLYFWMTKVDLAACAFDRVWMILQCY